MKKPTKPKPTHIKAIHIKPLASGLWLVDPVELPTSVDRKVGAIQQMVGGYFEVHAAKVARKNVLVYVNDEALVKGESRGFILGEGRPLFGSAVIVAAKENVDLTLSNKQMGNALRLFDTTKPTA
jgi:hypothetical protein